MRLRLTVVLLGLTWTLAGSASLAVAGKPDPAIGKWPTWPYPVTCGSLPFDPISAFGPPNAGPGEQPAETAWRNFVANHNVPWQPTGHWRLVAADDKTAELVSGQLSWGLDSMRFENQDSTWRWSGSGGCVPRSLRGGLQATEWQVMDPMTVRPRDRKLTVLVSELSCTGGADPTTRLEPPDVWFSKHRLTIATWVEPLPAGTYTCPSNPPARYEIRLPRPVGRRVLLDGGTYPPQKRGSTVTISARRAFPSNG
jgi:hypothetical protein